MKLPEVAALTAASTAGMLAHKRPRRLTENHNRNFPPGKILLVAQVLIRRQKQLIARLLGYSQQISVLKPSPSTLLGCGNGVALKVTGKAMRSALVKEYAHLPYRARGMAEGVGRRF